jgi:hypothetical protein
MKGRAKQGAWAMVACRKIKARDNMTNKQLLSKPLPDGHLSPTFLPIKGKGRAEDIKRIITKYE